MPPIDLVKYDDMSSAEKEAWLVKVFGTSGVGLMARDVFLGVNDGDIAPPETI